jgi:hypothetical protein
MTDQPRDFMSPRGQKEYAIKLAGEAIAHIAGNLVEGTRITILLRPPWASDDDHADLILLTTDKVPVVIEALKASDTIPKTTFEVRPERPPRREG